MGKSTETGYHLLMSHRIGGIKIGALFGKLLKERHGALLMFSPFAVHKRNIYKIALDRTQLPVKPCGDHVFRHSLGHLIGRKGARVVAEHIAWKLIQDKDKR